MWNKHPKSIIKNKILDDTSRNKKKCISTIHLDIAQAFDSVSHNQIYKRMKYFGYSQEIINTI